MSKQAKHRHSSSLSHLLPGRGLFSIVWKLLKLGWWLLVTVGEGLFWLLHGMRFLFRFGRDLHHARKQMKDGSLTCPVGHAVVTEPGPWLCQACGFTYLGSVFVCGNEQCATSASYVSCQICGLSCPSPFILGERHA